MVEKENRKYTVDVFYRPRKDQLSVVDMKEIKEKQPLLTGFEFISTLFNQIVKSDRKDLLLGSEGEMERVPISGSEGEQEALILLGSEG